MGVILSELISVMKSHCSVERYFIGEDLNFILVIEGKMLWIYFACGYYTNIRDSTWRSRCRETRPVRCLGCALSQYVEWNHRRPDWWSAGSGIRNSSRASIVVRLNAVDTIRRHYCKFATSLFYRTMQHQDHLDWNQRDVYTAQSHAVDRYILTRCAGSQHQLVLLKRARCTLHSFSAN